VATSDGRVDQLLLDEPDNYFADPTDVAITPDGRLAFVSGGGVDQVAVVDIERMRSILENASDDDRRDLLPNHLGVSTEFVERRIEVGRNPRGLAVSPDGRYVYVAEALDDSVAVIDVIQRRKTATIDLGGPEEITLARKGEDIFHSAEVTYGRQFSCHSCHPDGGIDNITYDIEPDGIGVNPVDNRTLRGILDTAPFKWTGKNATISRQCGPRLAVFFTRIDPFTPDQVVAPAPSRVTPTGTGWATS
jgi:YVTN family beta-propeller protein